MAKRKKAGPPAKEPTPPLAATLAQLHPTPKREGKEWHSSEPLPLPPPASGGVANLFAGVGSSGRFSLLLAIIVLLYFLLAAGYSAVTPAATSDQHNPDESAHLAYVATLSSGRLPVFTDVAHGYENHQPPLYYALCAPVYLATHRQGDAAATRAIRWVSILLGAILIVVVFRCIAVLFPEDPWLAMGTAAFVALLPGNVALSASVTNDALTTLVIAVALWMLVRLIVSTRPEDPPGRWRRRAVWLGITLGAGIWTKTLTLSLFPTTLIAFLLLARAGRMTGWAAAQAAGIALGLGLLLGAPWLLRNTLLYGDPLAQHVLLVTLNNGENNLTMDTMVIIFGGIGEYFAKVAQWSFASFWGGFDSMRLFWDQAPRKAHPNFLHGPTPTYQGLLALCLASIFGLALQARRMGGNGARPVAVAALAAQVVFTGIAFLNYNLHFFQAQGRYLYPALLPLAFFFVWGWRGLLTRPFWFPAFVCVMTAGLFALNLYTIFGLLLPRFS